ncbi:hypothetical protein BC826DRAFT_101250 [Russula brevipes]|nr:hypothetical protein BC826DRAFT_101250 [Russula brevipes]
MERHAHAASLFNAINHLFRRGQSSSADEQDQGHEVTSFAPSHTTSEDVEMPPVDLPSDTPNFNSHPALSTSDSSQLTSSPHTGAPATSSHSETSEISHPFAVDVDDDARSDASMPPLYEHPIRSRSIIFTAARMTRCPNRTLMPTNRDDLLVDDEEPSDNQEFVLQNENAPPVPSALRATAASGGNHRHVVVEEVEDQDQHRTNTIPPENSGQPVTPPHFEIHAHWHHLPHPHPHPHPHPPHTHPQPQFQPHPQQPPHQPHAPQPNGGVRLPNFPAMPGLRAQGHVEGPVPLPGLRTLFQPLIVEAVAQAGERFRTAQAAGGPMFGQGPAMGPPAPFVQVTFDVPVFRVPADPSTRQQQPQANARSGADAQHQADQTFEHERAFAAPPLRPDGPGPAHNHTPPMPTPNPNPIPADAVPPALRQLFEAAFDTGPGEPPTTDGPQIGATPGWTGLMGLLFGLGLGASHEFHREDPARAKRLVKGLEAVNAGLVKRMRKISEGSADGSICAICWDALLEDDSEISPNWAASEPLGDVTPDRGQSANPEPDAANSARPEPESEPEEPLPKVIALPCSHVFHSACLVPWFSRPKQTTCPTCRFNVDPENLTYEPPRRPQSDTREHPQQQRPIPQQPVTPQQGGQGQQEFPFGMAPPPQQAAPQQDGHPMPPPLSGEQSLSILSQFHSHQRRSLHHTRSL